MEHLREFKEKETPEDPSALARWFFGNKHHGYALTRDDSIQGRGRGAEAPSQGMWGVISASLGAMKPVVAKLDELLLAHPSDGMGLLSVDVNKISSYVDEMSEVEDPPRTAQCWMNEARELSYDMEDYMDNLLFVQPAGASHVANDMEAMVSEFIKYVREAIERYNAYVLPDSGPCSSLRHRFVSLGPMLPMSYEDIVIDRRMDEFINSFAKDGDKHLKVVWIIGSACLGKTTLSRVLYNKFAMQYDCRAFVQVSRKPDMKRIFHDMLWQLQRKQPPEYRNESDLIDNIKKYLQNKRYLIIVDDVWAASVCDTINDALPEGSHGSRIVTTTQIEDVALTCCYHQSELVFEMKPLDDDHSRELFFNRIFGSESNCPEIFQEVSNKIVEMCDGLPFATISIASLLASQPVITEDFLEHIHESLSSCFSTGSTSEITRRALNVSFNNLPQYLRTCLLYLSMYREGYIFFKDDLVKQWMAEGFIHTTEGQDAEKVAESYLHQLIGRRFIHPMSIKYNNEVLSCAVLGIVHDLISQKSAEENFIMAIDHSQKNVALSHKSRRLSLLFGDAKHAKTPENITKSQVRSLTYFGLLKCMPCITEFKLLRVLVLQIIGHGGEDNLVDLTGLSKLIQLRYLKIGCGIFIELPTDGLKCLETLDITDAVVIWSSDSEHIILPRLLHLSLPSEGSMNGMNGIEWIMGQAGRLNSLEDLYITFSSTYSERFTLGDLIQGYGKLRTAVFSHVSTVKNNVGRDATKVITSRPSKESITSGAPLLQRFECSRATGIIFEEIPRWLKQLQNLRILKITVKILVIDCVDILRGLRALTALSLNVLRETSERIIFDKGEFSALKYFNLRFTTGIAWLKFAKDTMPNLWKLKLVLNAIPKMDGQLSFVWIGTDRCKRYKTGNPLIVIEHMPSLREITAKLRGAAADLEFIKTTGISNDPKNPNMLLLDSSSYGDQQGEKDHVDETLDTAAAKRSPETLHVFTLDEIMFATNNFSRENFQGYYYGERNLNKAFCVPGVYKGNLRTGPTGQMPQNVTVKCLNKFSQDREWLMLDQSELEYLGALSCHPNLVKLLGFCDYDEHRMLVYEDYLPWNDLNNYMFDGDLYKTPWLTRLKIAVGTAKGLACLHGADMPIVQSDFKAFDVLLDSNHTVKLFVDRLANENSLDETQRSLTPESDVYNFGALLLSLVTNILEKKIKKSLVMNPWRMNKEWQLGVPGDSEEWWCPYLPYLSHEDKLHQIMDPSLKGQYSEHAAWTIATIVRRCLEKIPEMRPSMREVVDTLVPLLVFTEKGSEEN